jgi:3-methyladenine DNA glycosylase AlkD
LDRPRSTGGTLEGHTLVLVDEVRRRLAEAGDPAKAVPMQRYMKSAMPFHGVNAPDVRRICREAVAAHPLPDAPSWRAAVLALYDDARFREERYAAIQLCGHRRYVAYRTPALLDLYRHLVVTGAWWDLVDAVAGPLVGELLRAHHDEVARVLEQWAEDENLWVRRTAVLSQLGSQAATDVDLLRLVLERNLEDSLHGREFFVRKAVGWALRQHARVDPDWVRAFVDEHADRLSGLSRREALKHVGPGA